MTAPGDSAITHVVVCVLTYLRPTGLGRLLDHIACLDTELATVEVVVVDNDPAGSAEAIVEEARRAHPLTITYAIEPTRGITFARNRALDIARERGAEWIGWLDDDETPRADWLRSLVETQQATGADVVAGPSEPVFADDASPWITAAGVFDPARFTTGEPYPFFHTRTSGVILRAAVVPEEGFDNRLALTGGEDRVFFTRIHRSGASFVWDDGAVVDEWVPTSRVSVGWLVRRWFRTGVTRSLTLVYLDRPGLARRLRRVAGGLTMAGRGLVATLLATPRGRGPALRATRTVLLGLGASYGALGLHYREYRRIHGQ